MDDDLGVPLLLITMIGLALVTILFIAIVT